jgi:hypothetical protein
MKFQKGQSGNPAGRAPGTRLKVSMWAEGIMQEGLEKTLAVLMAKVEEGDLAAVKMVLDRIVPIRKAPPFVMPEHLSKAELLQMIMAAIADGGLTPGEALDTSKLAERLARALEKPTETPKAE